MIPMTKQNNNIDPQTLSGRLLLCAQKLGGKRQLANAAIISEAQLFRYINGLSDISLDKLTSISKAAQVDLSWLATGQEIRITPEMLRPSFRPALMQFTARVLDELLVEYQRNIPPRLKSHLLTIIYECLRHEEIVMGREAIPTKIQILRALSFFETLKTEELAEIYHQTFTLLEYGQIDVIEHHQLLNTFCHLIIKGYESYYNSYAGSLYFERIGTELSPGAQAQLNEEIAVCLQSRGRSDLAITDIGCGNGRHLAYLQKNYPNFQLTGIEPSTQGLELSRKMETTGQFPTGTFQKGDTNNIPLSNHSQDAVFMYNVLHTQPYIPQSGLGMEHALNEVSRVLKSQGLCIIHHFHGHKPLYDLYFNPLNKTQLETLAQSSGFKVKSLIQADTHQLAKGQSLKDCHREALNQPIWQVILQKQT